MIWFLIIVQFLLIADLYRRDYRRANAIEETQDELTVQGERKL
jgi:hypothetical protein